MLDLTQYKTAPIRGLDMPLMFSEKEHSYRIADGYEWEDCSQFISVTQLVGRFEPPFDSDAIAARVARKTGRTVQQVKAEWDYSRDMGTRVHANQESMMNGQPPKNPPLDDRERGIMTAGWKALRDIAAAGWAPYAAERMVVSLKFRVAGTIDATFHHGGNDVLLVDWKTNKRINTSASFGERMLPPLTDVECCEFSKYSLQLNMYRRILLEGYYPPTTQFRMMLVHLKPDGEYQPYDIKAGHEIDAILAEYLIQRLSEEKIPF